MVWYVIVSRAQLELRMFVNQSPNTLRTFPDPIEALGIILEIVD